MSSLSKKFFPFVLLFPSIALFISCKMDSSSFFTLTNWEYKTDSQSSYQQINSTDLEHLEKFVPAQEGFITIQTSFCLPDNLKNENIAIYIEKVQISAELFFNNTYIGTIGRLPPDEFYGGKGAASFLIPHNILNISSENELKIRIYSDGTGSISEKIIIGKESIINIMAKKNKFIMSDINFLFAVVLILISMLYFLLFFYLPQTKEYLWYALTNLTTIFYLIPHYQGSIPWITRHFSWLFFNQFFLGIAAFLTAYFATNFIRAFLNKKTSSAVKITRLIFLLSASIWIFTITTYHQFWNSLLILFSFIALQMIFAVTAVVDALINHNKNIYTLLGGFAPVLLTVAADFVIQIILKKTSLPYLTITGWQGTIVIFLVLLVGRFAQAKKRAEYLNTELESEVELRTKDLQKANSLLNERNRRNKLDLELAASVQQHFFPPQEIEYPLWNIAVGFKPLAEVSGDLYDFFFIDEKFKGFSLFDVSGHGLAAGLVTMLTKNIIQQKFISEINSNLEQVLYQINDEIISSKGDIENYLTGILFRLDEKNNSVEFVNAGHPHPLLYKKESNTVITLSSDEKQFGMIGIANFPVSFPSVKQKIDVGDIIICFTDGLTESENPNGEQFGTGKIAEIVLENENKSPSDILNKVFSALSDFTKNKPLQDDMTLIILKRKEEDIDSLPML